MGQQTASARWLRGFLALTALSSVMGCGGGLVSSPPSGGTGNVITQEMIGDPSNENAYTIVERLRPRWLSPRTQGTLVSSDPSFPEVYLDGVRYGPIDTLYRISGTMIARIEFMSGLDATTRFGLGHDGGAILVSSINSR
jgi:hypothetical protein